MLIFLLGVYQPLQVCCVCARPCVWIHFIHVWLSVTPWTVAHQALSIGFSRKEYYWIGLPCPPGDLPNRGILIISCCCIASVVSDSVRPHGLQPTRLLRPWDSPGKNTGGGCYFLLQCMKVKSESEVAQLCPTQRHHGLQPTRLLCSWDFPGKNTGGGCYFLLQFFI